MILFWDNSNDDLMLLGDDGVFWSLGYDAVEERNGNLDAAYYWYTLNLVEDQTPFSLPQRYDIYDVKQDLWMPCSEIDWTQKEKEGFAFRVTASLPNGYVIG